MKTKIIYPLDQKENNMKKLKQLDLKDKMCMLAKWYLEEKNQLYKHFFKK